MFFSKEQIERSLKRLQGLHPFWGTVFLAFKKAEIPIGETKNVFFVPIVENILQRYYHPISYSSEFYIPFLSLSSGEYWVTKHYTSLLLGITTRTFSDILIHPGGSGWGWQPDYIKIIQEKHLKNSLIPAFDLAVWLFRQREWDDAIQSVEVIETFFTEFSITDEERSLFDTSVPSPGGDEFQPDVVTNKTLLEITGYPSDWIVVGARLELLQLMGVGPAQQLECEFAPRLNLITGDNGLGKTFLLECAWWALTGTWPRKEYPAYPSQNGSRPTFTPSIAFQTGRKGETNGQDLAIYDWDLSEWVISSESKMLAGLCIFAQADGSFAIWDPTKYLLARERRSVGLNEDALVRFSRSQVWDGIEVEQGDKKRWICNGLIRDWVTWQISHKTRFDEFSAVLAALSPEATKEPLVVGQPVELPNEARLIPTLKFPYGEIPITLCSAGIQRIVALAYVLVWAWDAYVTNSERLGTAPESSIVLLVDEMEAHLHPLWQRTIVPAIMGVLQKLGHEVESQLIIATHSPLVLASVEPLFDYEIDSLFHLYLDEAGSVQLNEVPFVKRGRVDQWLMSDIFGLAQPRSKDAEETIEAAKELQLEKAPPREKVQEVSDRLVKVLAPDDEFWPLWKYFAQQRGVRL